MVPVAETLCRAIEHHKAGRLGEAVDLYQKILRGDPAHADALHLLGVAAHQSGDYGRATEFIRRAISSNDSFAPYYSNLGAAYRALGRLAEAIASYRDALLRDPSSVDSHFNLGNALKDQQAYEKAAASYRRAVEIDGQRADAWHFLGVSLRQLNQFDEAETALRQAISLKPHYADAHFELANVLRDEGRIREGISSYTQAISLKKNSLEAQINLGGAYEELGDLDRAIQAYERALQIEPGSAAAHFNRALAWLRGGDFARGWPEYEWRWQHNGRSRNFFQPTWDGTTLDGRAILIYSEQGIGDEILFSSCFSEVVSQARRCLIECDPRLVRLFSRSFPAARIFGRVSAGRSTLESAPEEFDVQIAAGSLPRLLRTDLNSFPAERQSLTADPRQVDMWRQRFRQLGGQFTVGISWMGGKNHTTRRIRSTTLEQLKPVLEIPDVQFVNLQYGDCRDEIRFLQERCNVTVHDWEDGNPLIDFDGFAARIAALDLVISVDNSTVHLAGGLGTPVWTLLPFAADWRWLMNVDKSLWYPSMKLFRQSSAGYWSNLLQTVADELRKRVRNTMPNCISCSHRPTMREALSHDDAEALFQLGNQLQSQGKLGESIEAYRRALQVRPDLAKARFNLANVLLSSGMVDEARTSFLQALEIDPAHAAQAHTNLGTVLRKSGRLKEAEAECDQALRANSNYCAAHYLRGQILQDRGELAEAAECYRNAITLNADHYESLNNLGTLYQEWKDFEAARRAYERAIAINPEYAEAHNNLGTLLHDLDNVEGALAAYRQALKIRPDFPEVLTNLGMILDQQGQGEAALALLERALALDPSSKEARFYRSIALLRQGRFVEGWEDFESRWNRVGMPQRQFTKPAWDGSLLGDRTILVHAEQGVGDEVFFASCLPDLLRQSERTLVECDPRLVPLFARSFPAASIYAKQTSPTPATGENNPHYDVQIASGSLPRLYRRSLSDFPADRRGYLIPDRIAADLWKSRLEQLGGGIKVGISWRGGSAPEDRRRRSTSLAQWRDVLSIKNAQFVNLQYGYLDDELVQLRSFEVHSFKECDPWQNLDDFAALMSALDLVISVDNATVHFAGALGVMVWVLLPWEADWRWMRNRTDTPWYPAARLFRQICPGDWSPVLTQVEQELREIPRMLLVSNAAT